jgi:mannitol-specific phosphotransferase system IIBC component
VQIDTADVLSLADQLRSAQARLTNLVAQMRVEPSLAQAIGRDVTAQQAALGDLTSKYVGVYTAIFGQAPVGLGNPILIAAAVAVILSYVAAQLYLWHQKQDVLEKQAQAQMLAENNRASILEAAQQQQDAAAQQAAAGDAAGAATTQANALALFAQAGVPGAAAPPPPGTQTFSDWIKANWLAVAGIAGAIFIVPKLVDR